MKRLSLKGRLHHKSTPDEKKRASGGTDVLQPADGAQKDDASVVDESSGAAASRTLFFGLPLPRELQDDEGRPIQQYTRNKIRTAKYTPLSFVPKNLWFQFHNIANIFFLFLVILVVSSACPDGQRRPFPPGPRKLTEPQI
jgi:phospholipid-translocating ATPase